MKRGNEDSFNARRMKRKKKKRTREEIERLLKLHIPLTITSRVEYWIKYNRKVQQKKTASVIKVEAKKDSSC